MTDRPIPRLAVDVGVEHVVAIVVPSGHPWPDPELDYVVPCPCVRGEGHPGWGSGGLRFGGPWIDLARRDGRFARTPPWMDHCYRVRAGVDTFYVAEPYQLEADDLVDLVFLAERGWDIEITSWRARHLPGSSLAVVISRPLERVA